MLYGDPARILFFLLFWRVVGLFRGLFRHTGRNTQESTKKGLYGAIFRHWQQVNTLFYKCTTKLFLLATSKRKKADFSKE